MIFQAKKQDIDGMILLLHQLFGIEEDFDCNAARQRKGLELLLDSTSSIIMVAKENHLVIAMGTAQLVISTAEGGLSLLIEDVVVMPSRQKRGIGSKILQALGDWGAERGASRMQLLADRNNSPAFEFYHNQGWQQTQLICLRKFRREDRT